MGSIAEAYEALKNFWNIQGRPDGTLVINFITYFKSTEAMFNAFDELSFAEVNRERTNCSLPGGMKVSAAVMKDMNRIVLVFLLGAFTRDQAREVVRVLSKHVDHQANKRNLTRVAADFATRLTDKGKGGVIWIDWPMGGPPG